MSDHDKYRSKVCVVCLRKAKRDRPLSMKDVELIKRFARENYDTSDPDFPSGLCTGCYLSLYKKEKVESTVLNVEPFTPDRTIQLRSTVCDCVICRVAKVKTFMAKKLKKKAGRPSNNVNASPSPFSSFSSAIASSSKTTSRPISVSTPLSTTITICRICCAEIYRGCRHSCISSRSSRKRKIDNLSNLLSSPETSK